MGLFETEALVLRTYNLAEADKIVVCFTHSAGLVRAVAKGCRRLKNRFGAALEPFTLLNISYYQRDNRDLVSLGNTEILKSHFNLSSNGETLTGLAYMADLTIEFSPPYQPNDRLFRMLRACLAAISASPGDMETVLRYFEVWILKLEGFLPDIKKCAECDQILNESGSAFIGTDLLIRCHSCSRARGTALSQNVHRQLRATQRLAPNVFAEESRDLPAKTLRDLADLTHQLIARVLERQPGVRPTFP